MINKNYLNRYSCRNFDNTKELSKEVIDELKQVINLSPTSTNSQSFSAIFVTDKKIKEMIKAINFNQQHVADASLIILFCADFNRSMIALDKANKHVELNGLNQFIISCVDCALAASNVERQAQELSLGCCLLGGLRSQADKLVEPLGIKGKCIPVLGLAIGYPTKERTLQPKINKCYDNKYDLELIKKEMIDYDQIMKIYYKQVYGKDDLTWSDNLINKFGFASTANLEEFIKKNFTNK